jgi:hypothetical protein
MTIAKVMWYMNQGLSLTQAVDTAVVIDHGIPAEDWSEVRSVSTGAVQNSVRHAQDVGLAPEPDDED